MRNLGSSILFLLSACIVSIVVFLVAPIYTVCHAVYMTFKGKKPWYHVAVLLWRTVDAFAYALGHIIYAVAYALDLMWNAFGEILEDMITAKEDTTFTQAGVTVSASVGKLEIDGDLNEHGKRSSKILNWFFNQEAHAADSWKFNVELKELQKGFFHKRAD